MASKTTALAPPSKGVKKYVKSCMDRMVELRIYDYGPSSQLAAGTAGTVFNYIPLSSITQGTAEGSRTGNAIRITRLYIRGAFIVSDTRSILRLIVVKDMQSNGGTPAVTDVLQTASYLSHYNSKFVTKVGGSRFVVLRDVVFYTQQSIVSTTCGGNFEWDLSSAGCVVTYSGNAGTVADVVSNNFFVMAISDNANTTFAMSTQLHFRDL